MHCPIVDVLGIDLQSIAGSQPSGFGDQLLAVDMKVACGREFAALHLAVLLLLRIAVVVAFEGRTELVDAAAQQQAAAALAHCARFDEYLGAALQGARQQRVSQVSGKYNGRPSRLGKAPRKDMAGRDRRA